MQDIYAKSLKSFPFFPTLINLDKVSKEIYDDGTVIERSTREWASSVFKDTDDIEARCEVVNGGFDQKAYLLTPFKYSTIVSEQFRQYRLRINPIGRREARFRDSLPGLPSVIHIDTSTQRNLDLLETMSSKEMWQKAPPSVRGLDQHTVTEGPVRKLVSNRRSHLSTAVENQYPGLREGTAKKLSANVETPSPLDMSHDDQTAQTHSATQSLTTPSMLSSATSRRLNELEELFRRQRDDNVQNAEISSKNATKLAQIEAKIGRIDAMDNLLNDNSEKLALTMERQQDSHVQIIELNIRVTRLMEVIDRMASRIEVITHTMVSSEAIGASDRLNTQIESHQGDGNRRRSLDEMKDQQEASTNSSAISTGLDQRFNQKASITQQPRSSLASIQSCSPTKKKSRALHDDMEEMSLGSDASDGDYDTRSIDSKPRPQKLAPIILDSSDLEDSDDYSSQMPDLDAQYNNHGDPEGGMGE
jgi:hypothetical protein